MFSVHIKTPEFLTVQKGNNNYHPNLNWMIWTYYVQILQVIKNEILFFSPEDMTILSKKKKKRHNVTTLLKLTKMISVICKLQAYLKFG